MKKLNNLKLTLNGADLLFRQRIAVVLVIVKQLRALCAVDEKGLNDRRRNVAERVPDGVSARGVWGSPKLEGGGVHGNDYHRYLCDAEPNVAPTPDILEPLLFLKNNKIEKNVD